MVLFVGWCDAYRSPLSSLTRQVDQVLDDIEQEIQRVCTPETFYRPWELRATL